MNALDWLPTPRTLIAAGLGTLVVLLIGGGVWFWIAAERDRTQAVHAEALAQAHAGTSQATPAAKTAAAGALEAALAQAPGAALAAQSAYELGNLRFDLGAYAPARAAYGVALATAGGTTTVRTLARAAIATTWEAERNFPQAVEAYTVALVGQKPGEFYYEDLLIGLARSQELAGKRDDAIQTYRRLLRDVPKLRRETEVRGRLASLGVAS
jgi:tetratricopeptide (TPR) repeat protein